jgi:hypothetical protein
MTQEFIAALRALQKQREEFKKGQEDALKSWEEENLTPLVKSCDHKYPWGEESISRDFSCSDIHCRICGRQLPRYS